MADGGAADPTTAATACASTLVGDDDDDVFKAPAAAPPVVVEAAVIVAAVVAGDALRLPAGVLDTLGARLATGLIPIRAKAAAVALGAAEDDDDMPEAATVGAEAVAPDVGGLGMDADLAAAGMNVPAAPGTPPPAAREPLLILLLPAAAPSGALMGATGAIPPIAGGRMEFMLSNPANGSAA